jgi:hypothetical protein
VDVALTRHEARGASSVCSRDWCLLGSLRLLPRASAAGYRCDAETAKARRGSGSPSFFWGHIGYVADWFKCWRVHKQKRAGPFLASQVPMSEYWSSANVAAEEDSRPHLERT